MANVIASNGNVTAVGVVRGAKVRAPSLTDFEIGTTSATSNLSTELAAKRDRTDNTCHQTTSGFSVWFATLPSGYTFGDAQPTFNSTTEKWTWYVESSGVSVDAESGTSTASATSATFSFNDSGTTVTFTATRFAATESTENENYVTKSYVASQFSSDNSALTETISDETEDKRDKTDFAITNETYTQFHNAAMQGYSGYGTAESTRVIWVWSAEFSVVQVGGPTSTTWELYFNSTGTGTPDATATAGADALSITFEPGPLVVTRSSVKTTVVADSIAKTSEVSTAISTDVTHAKSISATGVATACTPDSSGNVNLSSLFSSDNTSLQQQIDNATGTGSGTSIQLETRKTKTLDWSTQTTASTACNISFAAGSGLRYCELLLTGVTAANIDIVIDTTTYTLKSADSTALTPETGDNLLIFAEYATNCFIVSRQLLSTVS